MKTIAGRTLNLFKALFWSPGYIWKVLIVLLIGGYIAISIFSSITEFSKISKKKHKVWSVILSILKGFFAATIKIFNIAKAWLKGLVVALILAVCLLGIGQLSEWVLKVQDNVIQFKNEIQVIINNDKLIKELKATVKNLSNNFICAKIQVLSVDEVTGETLFRFSVLDQTANNPEKTPLATKEFLLPDSDIYMDFYVCNFDYSEIGEGLKNNIAVPYRLYSSTIAPVDGIQLLGETGIPLFFARDERSLFGIDLETYNTRIQDFSATILDGEKARKSGILREGQTISANDSSVRSSSGSAVHRPLKKGDKYTVEISNQGGIILKKAAIF